MVTLSCIRYVLYVYECESVLRFLYFGCSAMYGTACGCMYSSEARFGERGVTPLRAILMSVRLVTVQIPQRTAAGRYVRTQTKQQWWLL